MKIMSDFEKFPYITQKATHGRQFPTIIVEFKPVVKTKARPRPPVAVNHDDKGDSVGQKQSDEQEHECPCRRGQEPVERREDAGDERDDQSVDRVVAEQNAVF